MNDTDEIIIKKTKKKTLTRGEESKAASYMRSAAQSSYATGFGSRDYMSSVAKVHCQLRHW